MSNPALKAVFVLALPVVVLLGGGWIMEKWSKRDFVKKLLSEKLEDPRDRKPLNLRWSGYGVEAVKVHWGPLFRKPEIEHEKQFLQLDLAFPLVYGAALAISLWMAWATLGRAFHPAWLIAPVAVGMLADWTENLVQLRQLDRFRNGAALEATWIHAASAATVLKLLSLSGSYLFLAWLVYRLFKADSLPAS
jgi:hypothetical protein